MGMGFGLAAASVASTHRGQAPRLIRLADGRVQVEELSPSWRVKLTQNADDTYTVDLME